MREPIRDTVDLEVLQRLQQNGRATNRALAEAADLAPSTMLNRVRDLEASAAISGYHARVSLASLGRPLEALVFVRLRPKSEEIISRFVEHVWALPDCIGLHLITGDDDAVLHLAVSDAERLRQVVIRQISSFPEVFDERTSLLFEHRRRAVIEPA